MDIPVLCFFYVFWLAKTSLPFSQVGENQPKKQNIGSNTSPNDLLKSRGGSPTLRICRSIHSEKGCFLQSDFEDGIVFSNSTWRLAGRFCCFLLGATNGHYLLGYQWDFCQFAHGTSPIGTKSLHLRVGPTKVLDDCLNPEIFFLLCRQAGMTSITYKYNKNTMVCTLQGKGKSTSNMPWVRIC